MIKKNFRTLIEKNELGRFLTITGLEAPLTGETKSFDVKLPEGTEPLVFYTATTGMIETIGNMTSADTARGYVHGEPEHKFRVHNPFGCKKKERVYITEHLRLDGKPEYIATKHRIFQGQDNFVNVGYVENGKNVVKLIIDVITGEHKWF